MIIKRILCIMRKVRQNIIVFWGLDFRGIEMLGKNIHRIIVNMLLLLHHVM